ncbi:hypothetical protein ACHWQZ_G000826 [Mnemiopsis leidyi]
MRHLAPLGGLQKGYWRLCALQWFEMHGQWFEGSIVLVSTSANNPAWTVILLTILSSCRSSPLLVNTGINSINSTPSTSCPPLPKPINFSLKQCWDIVNEMMKSVLHDSGATSLNICHIGSLTHDMKSLARHLVEAFTPIRCLQFYPLTSFTDPNYVNQIQIHIVDILQTPVVCLTNYDLDLSCRSWLSNNPDAKTLKKSEVREKALGYMVKLTEALENMFMRCAPPRDSSK